MQPNTLTSHTRTGLLIAEDGIFFEEANFPVWEEKAYTVSLRAVYNKTGAAHGKRGGLKPLAQCIEALRADERVRFERTFMN
jgi:hypothetical protein